MNAEPTKTIYANALWATLDTICAVFVAYNLHSILPAFITEKLAQDSRTPQLVTIIGLAFLFNLALQLRGKFEFAQLTDVSFIADFVVSIWNRLTKK